MKSCRHEAIVLGVTDYRESDRLVTLFTRDDGKIRGIARGAKRSVRRFGGALELFARLSIETASGDGLARLQSADIDTIFSGIRRDIVKIAVAGYACELVDALTAEQMPAPRLFRLLSSYLDHLDLHPPSVSDRRFFEVNLLNILGYRPPLEECAGCGQAFSGTEAAVVGEGELFCRRCARAGLLLAPSTRALLVRALGTGRYGAVAFTAEELSEASSFLDPLLVSHLHRPLKSLPFLREMGG